MKENPFLMEKCLNISACNISFVGCSPLVLLYIFCNKLYLTYKGNYCYLMLSLENKTHIKKKNERNAMLFIFMY